MRLLILFWILFINHKLVRNHSIISWAIRYKNRTQYFIYYYYSFSQSQFFFSIFAFFIFFQSVDFIKIWITIQTFYTTTFDMHIQIPGSIRRFNNSNIIQNNNLICINCVRFKTQHTHTLTQSDGERDCLSGIEECAALLNLNAEYRNP